MPPKSALKSPTANNKKRKSSLVSPSRSNTPKKDDTKQLKLDTFFSKPKVRKIEVEETKAKVVEAFSAPPIEEVVLDDESSVESPVPLNIQQNVIIMDELSSDSTTSLSLSLSSSSSLSSRADDRYNEKNIEEVSKPSESYSEAQVVDEVMIEMSQTSNKLSPVNTEDSMDLFNDDCYAQFCKPSENKPVIDFSFGNVMSFDYEAEKRLLEEHKREVAESFKIQQINKELNEQIRQLEEESTKRQLEKEQQTPTNKQKMESMKKMLEDEGITDIDVSILDSQESNEDFLKVYLYTTIPEEIQRFYIFDIAKVLRREFKNGESFESLSQKVEQYSQFSVENYKHISRNVSHKLTAEQTEASSLLFTKFSSVEEFQELLDEFGVNLTKQNQKFEVICPEEIVPLYNVLQTNSKTISFLIKKMIQFQLKQPCNDISVFLITLFICMNRCVPQSMVQYIQGNIFNPSSVQISQELKEIFDSTLSNYLFSNSLLRDFNNCMKSSLNPTNINTVVEMVLDKFGFFTNVPSLDLNQVTHHSLLQTTKHYFPPCFSQFVKSKPFFNMSQAVRDLFKKMFLLILTQVTNYQLLSKDTILSYEGIPPTEQLIPLLKHSLEFMRNLSEECPVGNNANYACLHTFETMLSMLQCIFDKPIPKNLNEVEQEFKEVCSSFSQSLSDILPVENYRFFANLQLIPFLDSLFPSKVNISGSGIVQKTISSMIKKK